MDEIIKKAEQGINKYLEKILEAGEIDRLSYKITKANVITYLKEWLNSLEIDNISPNLKSVIVEAIENEKWEDLVDAFRRKMIFGTGGIRGLMANNKGAIIKLKEEGIDAKILKGPNTLNNLVLLLTSAGVAQFGLSKGFNKIVVGYDSRVRGFDFAKIIAELFLAYGYTVYLFDAPCAYPEVTFAIPYEKIKAQMGILISASHNDYRYNGYKLSCGNGSQFDLPEKIEMYDNFISKVSFSDIKILPIEDAPESRVIFLGGDKKLNDFNYRGHEESLLDIHAPHREHIKLFLLNNPPEKILNIGYCAFHGAGKVIVPRILNEIGFKDTKIITKRGLNELNGLFPCFNSEPGREQQPDPGDPRAANLEVECFKEEFPDDWDKTDILIGTDPDADRCGVIVKVPENQRFLYYRNNDYILMSADDMWTLLTWYRLKFDKKIDPEKTFVALTITTTDSITKLALKHKLGVVKTWVGFTPLAASIRDVWSKKIPFGLVEGKKNKNDEFCHPYFHEVIDMADGQRSYNLGAMEQSNGFSILGAPPKDQFSLGEGGHVRDKDGTFAAILIAEIAEWAKQNNTSIFELVDKYIYLDPAIGLFVNYYEPDPLDGEYPGIRGDTLKKSILSRTLALYRLAQKGKLKVGGLPVKSAYIYRTGKYDYIYPPTKDFQLPDEGVRFYFDEEKINHFIIRPSGTTNSMRFHVQLHSSVNENNLVEKKRELRQRAKKVVDEIRKLVGAPRSSEIIY